MVADEPERAVIRGVDSDVREVLPPQTAGLRGLAFRQQRLVIGELALGILRSTRSEALAWIVWIAAEGSRGRPQQAIFADLERPKG
jgi:hypothetical protein